MKEKHYFCKTKVTKKQQKQIKRFEQWQELKSESTTRS